MYVYFRKKTADNSTAKKWKDDNLEIASLMEQTHSDELLEFFQWQQLREESSKV